MDVLIDTGGKPIPVEIKSGATVHASFFAGLRYYMGLGDAAAQTGVLIHGGNDLYARGECIVLPWFRVT